MGQVYSLFESLMIFLTHKSAFFFGKSKDSISKSTRSSQVTPLSACDAVNNKKDIADIYLIKMIIIS